MTNCCVGWPCEDWIIVVPCDFGPGESVECICCDGLLVLYKRNRTVNQVLSS